MQKNKSASNNKENMSSLMAQEEHFVAAGEIKKDLNAVYIEDNPQKALEKLLNLAKNSNFQEKLQYIKHLAELLDLIGDEAINNLKQIIGFVKTDRDEVKRAFMSQTTALVSALQKRGDRGYQEIVNVVLPVVSDFLNAPQYEMKEEAGRLLTKIGKILNEDDKGKHLLTRVLGLAHDDENEENRTIAARLLSQMAPLFGKDLCEQFVGFEFLAMGDDPQFRVRKEAVSNLPSIGKVVSPQFFKQKLMPFYLKACRDSNWGVRLACVENLFDISQICRSELVPIREVELTEVILNFLKDANKGVKVGAYKVLGKFISTLHGHKIDPRLIDNFMKMADSAVNNLSGDNEIIHACAYNFPAVVYTLGASKWPFLLKLFQTLLKSTDSVRRPLAYSLHDIAKIIGEERAEKDLYQVLVKFLQDKNDDIKYGAIQNLALFFKVFRIEKREHMIDLLLSIQKDQKKWRIRELVAKQIEQLTLIFPPEISFQIIAPISFKLCNDPFATVREEAAKHIYALLRSLSDSEEIYRLSVIETVKGFSVSNRFTNRQAYVTMCQNLMKDPELFKANFLESLIPLANDKVPNVRIALAKALLKLHKRKSPLAEDPQIKQLYKKLKGDSSKDVKSLLSTIPEDAPAKQSSPKNTEIASASTAAQVTESSSTVVETSATENNSEDAKEEKVEQKEEVLVQEEKVEQKEEAPVKEEIVEQKEEVLAKEEEAEQKAEEEVVENKEENNVEQKAEEEVVQNKEEEKVEECQPQEAEAEGEVSNKIEEQAKQEDIVV